MRRHGFSLIELSIVLVIIGLIVGAIIVGQSLIRSSRIQNTVEEIARIGGAIEMFETKYHALPGDFTEAASYWSGVSNGDGDGNMNETSQVFPHLAAAMLINTPSPAPPFEEAKYQFVAGPYTSVHTAIAVRPKAYGIALMRRQAAFTNGPLDGVEAKAIDEKIDDGLPNIGSVAGYCDHTGGAALTCASCIASSKWVATAVRACELMFWLNGKWGIYDYGT